MGDKLGKVVEKATFGAVDTDDLFGKQQVDKADPVAAQLKKLRQKGAKMQLSALDKYDPEAGISQGLERQKKMVRGGLDDQRRRIQRMSAQRGLGGSSIGIGAALGAEERAQDKIRAIEAQRPGMMQQAVLDKISTGSGLIAQGGPIRMRSRKYRKGGIAPVLGAGLGAAFGGPQGAQIGAGIGQSLQSSM